MAITSVPNYPDLVQDYTIDAIGSAGGNFVPTSRLISTNDPLMGGGDLTGNLTLSVHQFNSVAEGTVPASGGGSVNFLRADGTWNAPGGAGGGYVGIQEESVDLTARTKLNFVGPDITAADNAGTSVTDVTLTRFTSITGGTVLPSGGGTVNFLRADGTWTPPPVAAGGVTLQATTPGTADIGHIHVTGTIYSDQQLLLQNDSTTIPALLGTHGSTGNQGLYFESSAGTLGSPTVPADDAGIGGLNLRIRQAGSYAAQGWFNAKTIGASGLSFYTDMRSGSAGQSSYLRQSPLGLRLYGARGSVPSNTLLALHALDMQGSLGLYGVAKVANYTQTQDDCVILLDSTAGAFAITLLTAAAASAGKVLILSRTDSSVNAITITGTVHGIVNPLIPPGDTWVIRSDGTNWLLLVKNERPIQATTLTSSTAINTTATKSYFDQTLTLRAMPELATMTGFAKIRYRAYGRYSTKASAAGTLQFFAVCNQGSNQDWGSTRAITVSNGVANEPWQFDGEFLINTPSNFRMVQGVLALSDSIAGVDKTLVMTRSLPAINCVNATVLKMAVQWGTSDVGNSILVDHQSMSADLNPQF